MPTASNRFAVSTLSRKNRAHALNEEMMTEKHTGQQLIKTPDGDVISYDSLARLRSHINNLTVLAQTNGLRGEIHSVEFDNLELPSVITEGENLLPSPLTVKEGNLKRFLFSVDVDTVELSDLDEMGYEPTISIGLEISLDSETITRTITGTLSEINTKIVNVSSYFAPGIDLTGHTLKITNLTITKNASYTNQALRHILHSMLIIVE